MNLKNIAVSASLAVCLSSFAAAQTDSFSTKDKMFLKNAAQSDMAEMKMAQLAMQKSSNDDIKSYAQQMMTDHQKLSDTSKPVADKAGLTPPTDVSPQQKAQYDKLSAMSGDKFDKAYVRVNVLDHKKVLSMFKAEAGSTQNSDIKTLTGSGEPVVADHEQKAEALASKMGVKTNAYAADKAGM